MQLIRRHLRRRLDRLQRSSDRGFTLIELLISVVIMGIIAVPMANVVIDYLLDAATVSGRISESQDESLISSYWQQDVSSVGLRSTTYDPVTQTFPLVQSVNAAFPCTVPGGTTTVVTLAWNQYDASGNATRISIAYLTQGAHLVRVSCSGTTLVSTRTIANDVNGTPSILCLGGALNSCTGTGPNVPTTISMTVAIKDLVTKGTPTTVTFLGQRRQT